jgi:DNA-directed RNA polymerase II subunit RPB1
MSPYNDFGPDAAGKLINDIQAIITQFNLYTGFSVGTSDLIANPATAAFVKSKIAEGRNKVAEILSKVHSGTYENISGMSDGEKLEDDIIGAMKGVANQINNEVVESLKKTAPGESANRIVRMVDSGSKGGRPEHHADGRHSAQQLIEGKRVQYTLQDRTLPHFARYDDGVESRALRRAQLRGWSHACRVLLPRAGRT